MAGYRSKKIMADRYADPITLDHIIELRRKLAEAEKQRDNALNACMALRKQIDSLQIALEKRGDYTFDNISYTLKGFGGN